MVARDLVRPLDPYQHPIRPMRAADGDAPAGSAWAFEFDWNGLRAIAYLRPDRLQLFSGASGRPITTSYPELAGLTALAGSRGELVLDGTIVASSAPGRPAAALLRKRMSSPRPSPALLSRAPVRFYLSDVLHMDGRATCELPYRRRRELLAELDLSGLPATQLAPYFLDIDGDTMLGIARQYGLRGVLAKRLESRYQPGRRSRAWIRTTLGWSRTAVPAVADRQPEPAAPADQPDTDLPDTDLPGTDPQALTEAVRLAQAEVRALRAQISPHFVYNALTTIAAYVRTDPRQARELLAEFAEYTRYSFRAGAQATTLGAELANVERYLTLEQARFADRLRVSRCVQEGLGGVVLPFLSVQPLVEHAVRHGIEGTPDGGTLSIAATADGPDCVITVAEDAGAQPELLAELTADLRARLGAAGHHDPVEMHTSEVGSSVTVRVPR